MRLMSFLFAVLFSCFAPAQELNASEVLERSITFHDPNGSWSSFQGAFNVVMKTPSSTERISTVYLDLPKQLFALDVAKDEDQYRYTVERDSCGISLNGVKNPKEEALARLKLSCDRALLFKDYYTYLYGLPMKLKDAGTILHPKVEQRTLKGKAYLVLRVDYDKAVGKDRWYFYFDPETYAMEVYQFYHDEGKNDGEYILLSGLETVNGIQMPKTRAWYYNKDDAYLGTDVLSPLR